MGKNVLHGQQSCFEEQTRVLELKKPSGRGRGEEGRKRRAHFTLVDVEDDWSSAGGTDRQYNCESLCNGI